MNSEAHPDLITVDNTHLRQWPLPMPAAEGDKEERGHVLILGGSREMPGAIILAATAALRAGAGKLTIATGASVAQLVALAIPEARVIGLLETPEGGFQLDAIATLNPLADKVGAILIGPGMQDKAATAALVRVLLPRLEGTAVVLDACAMEIISQADRPEAEGALRFPEPVIVTPHAGEMAGLTGLSKDEVLADPDRHAAKAAVQWNAVVALKGARTVICAPDGRRWQHEGGNIGLGISGSGDTLAGIICGLAARGAPLEQATCWGVALHARAGERLAERMGLLGYLAREIPGEIPALMEHLGR
jgi:hydroxyethylthiazole kinase-like uncharacterized protein yjeF